MSQYPSLNGTNSLAVSENGGSATVVDQINFADSPNSSASVTFNSGVATVEFDLSASAGVSSFNTRTGAVTAQNGDYSIGQITGSGQAAGKGVSDNAMNTVSSIGTGGIVSGHIAAFQDTSGTIGDGGPLGNLAALDLVSFGNQSIGLRSSSNLSVTNNSGSTLAQYKVVMQSISDSLSPPEISAVYYNGTQPVLGLTTISINPGETDYVLAWGIYGVTGIVGASNEPTGTPVYADNSGNLTVTPTSTQVGVFIQNGFGNTGVISFAPVDYQSGGGGGAVSSVFGRAGAVVAESGDYSSNQITSSYTVVNVSSNITSSDQNTLLVVGTDFINLTIDPSLLPSGFSCTIFVSAAGADLTNADTGFVYRIYRNDYITLSVSNTVLIVSPQNKTYYNQVEPDISGFDVTTPNSTYPNYITIMNPPTPLAAGTINLPPDPFDGQIVTYSSSESIASITINPGTNSISNPALALTAGESISYIFVKSGVSISNTWCSLSGPAAAGGNPNGQITVENLNVSAIPAFSVVSLDVSNSYSSPTIAVQPYSFVPFAPSYSPIALTLTFLSGSGGTGLAVTEGNVGGVTILESTSFLGQSVYVTPAGDLTVSKAQNYVIVGVLTSDNVTSTVNMYFNPALFSKYNFVNSEYLFGFNNSGVPINTYTCVSINYSDPDIPASTGYNSLITYDSSNALFGIATSAIVDNDGSPNIITKGVIDKCVCLDTTINSGEFLYPIGVPGQSQLQSLTSVATTATATYSSPHGYADNQQITITGASPSAYNGTFYINVLTPNTLSYTLPAAQPPATGTIYSSSASNGMLTKQQVSSYPVAYTIEDTSNGFVDIYFDPAGISSFYTSKNITSYGAASFVGTGGDTWSGTLNSISGTLTLTSVSMLSGVQTGTLTLLNSFISASSQVICTAYCNSAVHATLTPATSTCSSNQWSFSFYFNGASATTTIANITLVFQVINPA